ncbi:MAG: glycosyl hydrolase [Bacteroidales bacterium]|nr:glycosyl hydrolase [Bacteroidales bacterium]
MKKLICILALMGLVVSTRAQIDEHLADPEANEETRELYQYLRNEVWGKKVLSGCQAEWNYNINDAERIYKASGKYPKVNVFDFQHFDQPWINYRTPTAKQWHQSGGIVSFMWHIHMPTNAFVEQKSDWEGFYIHGEKPCHILPSRCATEETLENRIFQQKLEGVAQLLLYYQSQGIPIIWRPLHEASGQWFWWGAEDGAAYKQLYRYMFDYFCQAGVHNLIWVWTSETGDDDWYPGDEYVDIVARDGYPKNNTTHISQAEDFRRLRQAHPNKMTALPECNSVPSWENMQKDNALWLMVAPWCGGGAFDYGNTNEFWEQFLSEENIIHRD